MLKAICEQHYKTAVVYKYTFVEYNGDKDWQKYDFEGTSFIFSFTIYCKLDPLKTKGIFLAVKLDLTCVRVFIKFTDSG